MRGRLTTRLVLVLFASSAFFALPATAEMYKWTDAQGRVHYSDQPPPPSVKQSTTVKPTKPRAPPPAPTPAAEGSQAAAPKTAAEQEADFRKRRVEAAEREAAEQKAAQDSAEKNRNCVQSQNQLKSLQAGGRKTRLNSKGEQEYLNDTQIAQEIERAKKAVDSWCK